MSERRAFDCFLREWDWRERGGVLDVHVAVSVAVVVGWMGCCLWMKEVEVEVVVKWSLGH